MKFFSTMFLITLFLMAGGVTGVSAATIIGTAPVVHTGIGFIDDVVNQEIEVAFNDALIEANLELSKYSNQIELAKGFGNATAFSSYAGTSQGFQNYSKMSITTGVMIGVQAPSTNFDYYDSIEDDIEENGDIYAGVASGISFLNVGVTANSIHSDLYLNVMFGSHKNDIDDEIEFSTLILGVGANYTLVKPKKYSSLFNWRGVSVGSGLFYHKSDIKLNVEIDGFSEEFSVTDPGTGASISGTIDVDPSVLLELNSKTLTIPLDVVTSAQVLQLFNFTFGAGFDFNLGKTDIIVTADGDVEANNIDVQNIAIQDITPGFVIIDGSTTGISPSFARLRVMTGLGFNFGPVKLDIPIRYYFGSGAAVGVTAGVVF